MPIQVFIAAIAVSASIPILWWSLASNRTRSKPLNPSQPSSGNVSNTRQLMLESGAGQRVVLPAVKALGATLLRVSPVGWADSLRRRLVLGGSQVDNYALERLFAAKFALGALGFLLGLFLLSDASSLRRFLLGTVLAVVGFMIPDAIAANRGRKRQEQIEREMPDTLDQVTMSVEAGIGFEAALARTARTGDGPLAAEINRTLREIQLGIPRDDALRKMADRTDVSDLDSFVLAVVQSEEYGIPIGKVLRVQSDELRDKRRQRAEERALKIPVLLIFPLVFCIFPAMFIVLLGPAAISIMGTL
ncbi:MAG: type II secretion system F family protein [Actinomycetia bacterium]|nr:type II secretion system F family protein [Actinomycetes bacterium]